MTEPKRNEIISRWRAGSSIRMIAREMGMARNTVSGVLAQIEAQRAGHEGAPIRRRPSRLDPYEPFIQELLGRYPDLTAVRLLEELRQRGFRGGYTLVRQRLGVLRPRRTPLPVIRFETAPGAHYGKSGVMFSGTEGTGLPCPESVVHFP
jgi:transposase